MRTPKQLLSTVTPFLVLNAAFSSSTEMEMANAAYSQPHGPPNQTAPWPDQMLTMDHYGNHSRWGPRFKGKTEFSLGMGHEGAD